MISKMKEVKKMQEDTLLIDSIGLISIGLFSLGYILWRQLFAELHIQIRFFDFPIFIGELLFIFILMLLLFRNKDQLSSFRLDYSFYLIAFYALFVIMKTWGGYHQGGPFALRNAALFYYPFFCLFAYSFSNKVFFEKFKYLLFFPVFIFFLVSDHNSYWLMTFLLLGFFLILSYKRRILKFIALFVLLMVFPYESYFLTARMMIVSYLAVVTYLIVSLFFCIKLKPYYKSIIIIFLGLLIFIGLLNSDRNALLSLITPDRIIEMYKENNQIVQERKPDYRMEKLNDLKIYNPNRFDLPSLRMDVNMRSKICDSKKKGMKDISSNEDGQKLVEDVKRKDSGFNEKGLEVVLPDNDKIKSNDRDLKIVADQGKNNVLKAEEIILKSFIREKESPKNSSTRRDLQQSYVNIVFRLFIWRDMLAEMFQERPVFGFSFGKPLRSISLEILNWGSSEWRRDGWIAPHNSYLHIVYRAGIVGILFICFFLGMVIKMIIAFCRKSSVPGLLLCGILINWLVAANFLLILELPYTAIPFWSLFGLTLAYYKKNNEPNPLGQ